MPKIRKNGRYRGMMKVIFTALLSVAALFIITKLMGHKQVAQLDFFDYVCGITIGSIGAELATELDEPYKPIVALLVYGIVALILNFVTRNFPRSRKYINGSPTVLMREGRIYRANLKRAKLDMSEFMLLCREEGYFDLDDIAVAVFEHNGRLSVLPRSVSRPLTPQDVGLSTAPAHIGTELIMDGRIMSENLLRIGRNEAWLKERLWEQECRDHKAVLLAIYRSEDDALTIYTDEDD